MIAAQLRRVAESEERRADERRLLGSGSPATFWNIAGVAAAGEPPTLEEFLATARKLAGLPSGGLVSIVHEARQRGSVLG